jgi:transcriptional regulator with XRE-family HTH domain
MDFKNRLERACGSSSAVPEYGMGRQTYLAKEIKVSQEAVRKWFSGESKPRAAAMAQLAKLLNVELVWLSLGVEHSETESNRAVARRQDTGLYALTALLIHEGYAVAFTTEGSDASDITAMRDGVIKKFRAHTFLADSRTSDFNPTASESITDVACVINNKGLFCLDFLDLTNFMGEGALTLKLPDDKGNYRHGKKVIPRIKI